VAELDDTRDLEAAAERLRERLRALDEAVRAEQAERARLLASIESLRAERADAQRRVGALEAENAALHRERDLLAARLDALIEQVESRMAETG